MTDVHSKKVRSYNMSRIGSKNTKPEIIARKFLFSQGFRFRIHAKKLPGKPDIVLPKYKTVIFINGCFWHGHKNCKCFVLPKTRTEWWEQKINRNVLNDAKKKKALLKSGWKVIQIWECQLKSDKREKTFEKLLQNIAPINKI